MLDPKIVDLTRQHHTLKSEGYTFLRNRISSRPHDVMIYQLIL